MADVAFVAKQESPGFETVGVVVKKDVAKEAANILIPSLLFALLAPGSILHIPPPDKGQYKGQIYTPGLINWQAVLVHTLIFALVLYLLRTFFPSWFY